ncbi:MAG: ABC transporter ATP-binding protein [Lachnospiraceae bacterium]|nr:ABC transporter ATP-binding protein [Lachnospiraceae bacterium]
MIEAKNLSSGYGRDVIEIDEMCIKKGEITAIIGCNGSGKTTLLKTLSGVLRHRGKLLADDRNISLLPKKERARLISYLPQSLKGVDMDTETLVAHGRYPYMGLYGGLRESDIECIKRAMAITDVNNIANKKVSAISGGERQRAYIAMSIAQDAGYMLFDEPCTYMDISHQLKFIEIIRKLKAQGKGIVITSHDLPFSFTVSDKIYIMKEGRLTGRGKPDDSGDLEELSKATKKAMGVNIIRNVINSSLDSDCKLIYDYSIVH